MRKVLRRPDFLIACLVLVACMLLGNFWLPAFLHRSSNVHALLVAPRDLVMVVYISRPAPGLRSESWAFHDLNGYSRIRYTVVGPRGDATVTEPPTGRIDVPALFDYAKSANLWNIPPGTGAGHIRLAARTDGVWRYHDIYFDTAIALGKHAREYQLDLSKNSAENALAMVKLNSTPSPDGAIARYIEQVRAFGTPAFRAACQAARNQVQPVKESP